MENTTEPQIKEKKMRLWNPCSTVIDHEIDDKDKNNIYIELMRKIRAIENNKQFVPDSNKDSLLRKSYEPKTLDLFNKHDILTIFKSIKCENMRRQSFFFLEYYRNEMKIINELTQKCSQETDPQQVKCLLGIIRQKKINVDYIEIIRGKLTEIFSYGEEAAAHMEKCFDFIHKK